MTLQCNELAEFGIGALMTGRQLIWHIIQFDSGSEMFEGEMFSIQDLKDLPWSGVANAPIFVQGWELIYFGMPQHPLRQDQA